MEKKYKVTSYQGMLSTTVREYVGTLPELANELKTYLGGVKPRKPESFVKRLNDNNKKYNGTYWEKSWFIEEVE